MKKLNSKDAKEIGEDIGINWKSVKLSEFTKGVMLSLNMGQDIRKLMLQIMTRN